MPRKPDIELRVSAQVFPTEDPKRVMTALKYLFPSLSFKGKGTLSASAKGRDTLDAFKKALAAQQIRDTARGFLLARIHGESLQFSLNKQAAAVGKVNLLDFDTPLGNIDIGISGSGLEALIEWLTKTDGREDED